MLTPDVKLTISINQVAGSKIFARNNGPTKIASSTKKRSIKPFEPLFLVCCDFSSDGLDVLINKRFLNTNTVAVIKKVEMK